MASKPKYNPVTKRWRFWWHATFKDGTVYKGSKTFKTKAEAYRHKKIVESKIRLFKKNPPAPSPLFSVAVKTWLDHCRQFSKDTQKLYRSHTGLFAAAVCKDDPLVKSIKDRDLMAYLAGLQSKGLKSSTINNHRRSLKSFFKFTSQRFSIPNPAIDVER